MSVVPMMDRFTSQVRGPGRQRGVLRLRAGSPGRRTGDGLRRRDRLRPAGWSRTSGSASSTPVRAFASPTSRSRHQTARQCGLSFDAATALGADVLHHQPRLWPSITPPITAPSSAIRTATTSRRSVTCRRTDQSEGPPARRRQAVGVLLAAVETRLRESHHVRTHPDELPAIGVALPWSGSSIPSWSRAAR